MLRIFQCVNPYCFFFFFFVFFFFFFFFVFFLFFCFVFFFFFCNTGNTVTFILIPFKGGSRMISV